MKAPDKSYFEIDEKGKVHTYFGLQPDNATEYIRKDALLEWLKAKRAPFMGDNDYGKGNIDALDEVIDKLNEM